MTGKSIACAIALTAVLANPLSAKPVGVLLQEGIYQEETLGDLDAAIKIYQQIVNQELGTRPHVVRAKYRWGLCLIDTAGGEVTVLWRSDDVQWLYPTTWSPDGTQIVGVAGRTNAASEIVSIAVADGSLRTLREFPPPRHPGGIGFSPDGQSLVFQVEQADDVPQHDIFLLAADGSWEIPLVKHAADDRVLGWIPDGRGVLFRSDRKGTTDAWIAPVQDGKPSNHPTLVKSDLGEVRPYGFSTDGAFFYATWGPPEIDLFFAPLNSSTADANASVERSAFGVEGNNLAPDWSPDGEHLAYISSRRGGHTLAIRSLDTGEERRFALRLFAHQLRWCPDGNAILIRGYRFPEGLGLYRFDPRTAAVDPIVLPCGKEPCWSPDGRVVYYARDEHLAALDVDSGTERIIHRASAKLQSVALSPDGRRLAFVTGGRLLQVIAVDGDQPPQLLVALDEGRIPWWYGASVLAWSADGNHLFYGTIPTGAAEYDVQLWRIAATGGEPEALGLTANRLRDLRMHPEGQRIAFVAGGLSPLEMWVMENFLPTQDEVRKETHP